MKRSLRIVALGFVLGTPAFAQTVIRVPEDVGSIQDAILLSGLGDVVLVGPGTYNEAIDFLGLAVRVTGSGPGVSILDGTGISSSVVRFRSGEGAGSVLEGFTVTGGVGMNVGGTDSGGGIVVVGSGPVIRSCEVTANTVAGNGGGMAILGGSAALLEDVSIAGNQAQLGGGLYVADSTAALSGCSVVSNTALHHGGGLNLVHSTIDLTDCSILSNVASSGDCFTSPYSEGGGVWGWDATVTASRVKVNDNFSQRYGGGFWLSGTLSMSDSEVCDNRAGGKGGGLGLSGSPEHMIVRTIIARNGVGGCFYGNGGAAALGSHARFDRCVFYGNTCGHWGALFNNNPGDWIDENHWTTPGSAQLTNCITWGNASGFPGSDWYGPGTFSTRYCDNALTPLGEIDGTGNISAEPRFWEPDADDFRLMPSSPCLDAGDPADPLDPDGTIADIGIGGVVDLDMTRAETGHRYVVSEQRLDLPGARAFAQAYCGRLAEIDSQEEQDWISGAFGLTTMWIGASDEISEGEFAWDSGRPLLVYSNWAVGQPDDFGPGEDFVILNYHSTPIGNWNDIHPGFLVHALVEIEDCDGNGIGDACQADTDGDFVIDACDTGSYGVAHPVTGVLYAVGRPETLAASRATAARLGGHLVAIEDAAEQQWILETFGTNSTFWIGLSDEFREGAYKWDSRAPLQTAFWGAGEPNNGNGIQDHVALNYNHDPGAWYDRPATDVFPPIIELDGDKFTKVEPTSGHVYQYLAAGSVHDARIAAAAMGGRLAVIDSAIEQAWIRATFDTQNRYWIGLSDESVEGQFVWDGGGAPLYLNWNVGEPNDGGASANQDHVIINWDDDGLGRWNDQPGTTANMALIETEALNATFRSDRTSGFLPMSVSFRDTSTGPPNSWLWDFGDGTTSTLQHPVHVYRKQGEFTVTLMVTGPGGLDTQIARRHIIAIPRRN